MFPPGRGRANGSGLWVIGRAGCRGWARHTVGVGPGCPCAVVERPLRGYEDGGGGWGCSAERGGRRRAGPISTRKRPVSVEGAGVIRGAGRRG